MVERRGKSAAGLPPIISCDTYRTTRIIEHLDNGDTVQNAQAMAPYESPKRTKLYDQTAHSISMDEVEGILKEENLNDLPEVNPDSNA